MLFLPCFFDLRCFVQRLDTADGGCLEGLSFSGMGTRKRLWHPRCRDELFLRKERDTWGSGGYVECVLCYLLFVFVFVFLRLPLFASCPIFFETFVFIAA